MNVYKALKNHSLDNVATIFVSGVEKGDHVEIFDSKGNKEIIKALGTIPFGHKIAILEIALDDQVTKYGEEIGKATVNIKIGEHVHIHNIESIRGRGDWEKDYGGGIKE